MKGIYQHQGLSSESSFSVREYHQRLFTSPYHFHDCYELILIAKSHGKLYAGTKVLNFDDGDVFIFSPQLAHCFYNDPSFADCGELAHAIVIFIHEDFLGPGFFSKPELAKVKELLQQSKHGIKVMHPTENLHSSFKELPEKSGMTALIHLLKMLDTLSNLGKQQTHLIDTENFKSKVATEDMDRLDAVFKYVMANFKEGVSSKEAAGLAHLNEAAFCRYFKNRTDKTFSQFVNYVRVTHATQLLMRKNWSISNICFECGYSNISYFNREFKSLMGMTPMTYKKNFSKLTETDASPIFQDF
jgi:AraC-like DNA-binding protein